MKGTLLVRLVSPILAMKKPANIHKPSGRAALGPGLLLALALALPGPVSGAASTNTPPGPLVVETEFTSGFGWNWRALERTNPHVSFWLESSLARVFPTSPAGNSRVLRQLTPRNARCSFQACVRNERSWPMDVECAVAGAEGLKIQVRRVGFVPQWNFTADTSEGEFPAWCRTRFIPSLGRQWGLGPHSLFGSAFRCLRTPSPEFAPSPSVSPARGSSNRPL